MIRPKIVIEDRLTDKEREELHTVCEKIDQSDMSPMEKASALSAAAQEAQKTHDGGI